MSLEPEWLGGLYSYSGFFEFIKDQCLIYMNIQGPKVCMPLHMVHPKQNCDFLKNSSYDFYLILIIYGDHIPEENCTDDTVRKILVHSLQAQTGSTDFIETRFTARAVMFEKVCAVSLHQFLFPFSLSQFFHLC
jgi:hypothetical protein